MFHPCVTRSPETCVKLIDLLTKMRSSPNEIKMCRICASNESCGSGEMVSGATGREFRRRKTVPPSSEYGKSN